MNLDRWLAIALSAVALIVYVLALPPSYAFWDTGELQVVSIVLGIAHPPGSPAFVLLGWLFAHGLPFGDPAWRVTLMSAVAVAASAGLLYATGRALGLSRAVAAIVTLGFAFSAETLVYATRAEGHDLVLCFSACALYFGTRYARTRGTRDLFAVASSVGLLGSTHGVALFLLPAIALLVALRPPPRARRRAATLAVVAGLTLGLAPYAYIEPRSAYLFAHRVDRTLALGLPAGAPFWDYGNVSSSPQSFWRFVTGAEFHVHSGFAGYVAFDRYPQYAAALAERIATAYGTAGVWFAAFGALPLIFKRGAIGKTIVLAAVLTVPYTQSYADLQDPDRYYLLALWCAAIAIGLAFEIAVRPFWKRVPRVLRGGLLVALALGFVFASGTRGAIFAQARDDSAPRYVAYLRSVLPNDAIVLADWAYSSPIAYAAYVDRSFGDRIPVSASATQYERFYPGWLRAGRPVYMVAFDNDLSLPGYRVRRISFGQSFNLYQIQR